MGLVIVSCSEKNRITSDEVIYLEPSEIPFDSKSLVESFRLIPLEVTDNSILREASKIEKKDSTYCIFDRTLNVIYLFNLEGKYKSKIDRKGNGPNEYTQVMDFFLWKDMIVLLAPLKLIFIDLKTLEIAKEQVSLGSSYHQIIIENENCYLYNKSQGTLDVYNLENKELKNIFNNKPLKGLIPFNRALFIADNNIYMNASGSDILYTLKDNQLKPVFTFDYKNKKDILSFYATREIGPLEMHEIGKYSLPSISNIIKIQNNLTFIYSFRAQFLVNSQDKNNRINCYLTTDLVMNPDVFYTENNKLVSWVYLFSLGQYPESAISKSEVAKIKQTNSDPGTIILTEYSFKE